MVKLVPHGEAVQGIRQGNSIRKDMNLLVSILNFIVCVKVFPFLTVSASVLNEKRDNDESLNFAMPIKNSCCDTARCIKLLCIH